MAGRTVKVAIVGTGFIAETRARSYASVTGYDARLVAAVSRTRERAEAYARRHGIADVYTDIREVLETSAGWSPPAPDEDWAQGHRQMVQDFVACVAEGRAPLADGELGLDPIRVVYAGYVSAEEGRRVQLDAD